MKKLTILCLIFLSILILSSFLACGQANYSRGRTLGLGFQYTVNFPASGLSMRIWFADFLGLEGDLSPITLPPSFAFRLLIKTINTSIVDLYFAGAVGFDPTLTADYQIGLGIEISPAYNFAFNGEVGYALIGGSVTAGSGIHLYF